MILKAIESLYTNVPSEGGIQTSNYFFFLIKELSTVPVHNASSIIDW